MVFSEAHININKDNLECSIIDLEWRRKWPQIRTP